MRSAIVSLLMPSLLGGTIVTGAAIKGSVSHKSGVKSRGQGADNLLQGRATQLVRRGEPGTGDDDFPDDPPHPNKLDQVETAFNDAIELTSYVLSNIDGDNTIFNTCDSNGISGKIYGLRVRNTCTDQCLSCRPDGC